MRNPGIVTVLLLLLLFIAAGTCAAAPLPPHVVSYQGRISDAAGNPLSDGPHSVSFVIWADSISTNVGDVVWMSGPVVVTTAKGLFSVGLGSGPQPALASSIFQDSARWLGITVGLDPEILPRTRMVSVPYSLTAEYAVTAPNYLPLYGGTMTGSTTHTDAVDTWTSAGKPRVQIGPNEGYIVLNNDQVSNPMQAALAAVGGSGLGGALWLGDYWGTGTVYIDAGNTSTSSVQLPDGAIDAHEILDEPGISSAQEVTLSTLSCGVTTNLLSTSITIPSAGYIVIDAHCEAEVWATAQGTAGGAVGIDESPTVTPNAPYRTLFEHQLPGGGPWFIDFPTSTYRIYFKSSPGTYTFYLNATKDFNCGTSWIARVSSSMMRATYYSTSYGTVTSLVGDGEQKDFANSLAVHVTDSSGKPTGETMYEVDLRELELKAAKARAEAESAERKLEEAKLAQRINQDRQSAR